MAMGLHFDWTVKLGDLLTIGAVIVTAFKLWAKLAVYDDRFQQVYAWYCVEHNIPIAITRDKLWARFKGKKNGHAQQSEWTKP